MADSRTAIESMKFIDLKIAARLLCTRPFHIVCTSDGFVGKRWLMRSIGCIPARKFMTDVTLVRDMVYAVRELRSSVLMFPEASYSGNMGEIQGCPAFYSHTAQIAIFRQFIFFTAAFSLPSIISDGSRRIISG